MRAIRLIITFVFISFSLNAQNQTTTNPKPGINASNSTSPLNNTLNFLVVGDWGRNGENHQKDVASQMGVEASKINAKFVISTGDNIYPSGVISPYDPAFHYSFENIFTAFSLQCDWYLVLGNHDYKTDPDAEIAYSKISRRWKMPARYYSKKVMINKDPSQQILLVFIDSNPFCKEYYRDSDYVAQVKAQDTTAQKIWLEKVLSDTASNIKWKIVIAHHPLYTGGPRKNNPDIIALRGSFKEILDKYKVDVYISGHEHSLQHIVPGGKTQYFISGAGSELTSVNYLPFTKFAQSVNGFMSFKADSIKISIRMIDYTGKLIYQTTVKK